MRQLILVAGDAPVKIIARGAARGHLAAGKIPRPRGLILPAPRRIQRGLGLRPRGSRRIGFGLGLFRRNQGDRFRNRRGFHHLVLARAEQQHPVGPGHLAISRHAGATFAQLGGQGAGGIQIAGDERPPGDGLERWLQPIRGGDHIRDRAGVARPRLLGQPRVGFGAAFAQAGQIAQSCGHQFAAGVERGQPRAGAAQLLAAFNHQRVQAFAKCGFHRALVIWVNFDVRGQRPAQTGQFCALGHRGQIIRALLGAHFLKQGHARGHFFFRFGGGLLRQRVGHGRPRRLQVVRGGLKRGVQVLNFVRVLLGLPIQRFCAVHLGLALAGQALGAFGQVTQLLGQAALSPAQLAGAVGRAHQPGVDAHEFFLRLGALLFQRSAGGLLVGGGQLGGLHLALAAGQPVLRGGEGGRGLRHAHRETIHRGGLLFHLALGGGHLRVKRGRPLAQNRQIAVERLAVAAGFIALGQGLGNLRPQRVLLLAQAAGYLFFLFNDGSCGARFAAQGIAAGGARGGHPAQFVIREGEPRAQVAVHLGLQRLELAGALGLALQLFQARGDLGQNVAGAV